MKIILSNHLQIENEPPGKDRARVFDYVDLVDVLKASGRARRRIYCNA
jgi:hypothetical protein